MMQFSEAENSTENKLVASCNAIYHFMHQIVFHLQFLGCQVHVGLCYKIGIPACNTDHVTNHVMVLTGNHDVDSFPVEGPVEHKSVTRLEYSGI